MDNWGIAFATGSSGVLELPCSQTPKLPEAAGRLAAADELAPAGKVVSGTQGTDNVTSFPHRVLTGFTELEAMCSVF